jgi:hypothetical protein
VAGPLSPNRLVTGDRDGRNTVVAVVQAAATGSSLMLTGGDKPPLVTGEESEAAVDGEGKMEGMMTAPEGGVVERGEAVAEAAV